MKLTLPLIAALAALSFVPMASAAQNGCSNDHGQKQVCGPVPAQARDHAKETGTQTSKNDRSAQRTEQRTEPRRFNRGERLGNYAVIDNPGRYGLRKDQRYAQRDGYVYRIDRDTGTILAVVGLLSALTR